MNGIQAETSAALAVSEVKMQIRSKFCYSIIVQTQLSDEVTDFEALQSKFQESLRIEKDSKQVCL